MSCLGNCGNCNCEKLDVCLSTDKKTELLEGKLKVIRDYGCLLSQSTCLGLPKVLGRYAYYIWCCFRDIRVSLSNLNSRVDNLCLVAKCQDEKLQSVIDFVVGKLVDYVEFNMSSTSSTGENGDTSTYTKIDTQSDGSFTIRWNMTWLSREVGKGVIRGKVNQTYTQNTDGSIRANIQSITLIDATYTLSGGNADNHSAGFTIYDHNGTIAWHKPYDPTVAWSEVINKTIQVNKYFDVAPKGGTTKTTTLLSTWDDWLANDTRGTISASYTNNHNGIFLPTTPCDIKCTACEYKEE